MKEYEPGTWGLQFIFSLEGSVFPKALAVATPNAMFAVGLWYLCRYGLPESVFQDAGVVAVGQVWSAFNWSIGFMVSFRAQQAYSRWWEGGSLLQQARGEWFNAYSSLIAFCTNKDRHKTKVLKFHHTLARLLSMLHASALLSIATEHDDDFEILPTSGLDESQQRCLRLHPDKCEILMQWIQRLIVENMDNGVLGVSPPVLSRVFQELSRGIVNIHNVRKISEFQFPFPLAQITTVMLIVQWALTPIVCSLLVGSPVWAGLLSFFPVLSCWGINYVASEIEQPFGTDTNDIPLHAMQHSMNSSIMGLLDEAVHSVPCFDMTDQGEESEDPLKMTDGGNLPPNKSVRWLTSAGRARTGGLYRRFEVAAASPKQQRRGSGWVRNSNILAKRDSTFSVVSRAERMSVVSNYDDTVSKNRASVASNFSNQAEPVISVVPGFRSGEASDGSEHLEAFREEHDVIEEPSFQVGRAVSEGSEVSEQQGFQIGRGRARGNHSSEVGEAAGFQIGRKDCHSTGEKQGASSQVAPLADAIQSTPPSDTPGAAECQLALAHAGSDDSPSNVANGEVIPCPLQRPSEDKPQEPQQSELPGLVIR